MSSQSAPAHGRSLSAGTSRAHRRRRPHRPASWRRAAATRSVPAARGRQRVRRPAARARRPWRRACGTRACAAANRPPGTLVSSSAPTGTLSNAGGTQAPPAPGQSSDHRRARAVTAAGSTRTAGQRSVARGCRPAGGGRRQRSGRAWRAAQSFVVSAIYTDAAPLAPPAASSRCVFSLLLLTTRSNACHQWWELRSGN